MTTLAPSSSPAVPRSPTAPRAGAFKMKPVKPGGGDPGRPYDATWRLDLLADDGTTTHVYVPESTTPDLTDRAEALVTSALTGLTFRPAGRTLRGGP